MTTIAGIDLGGTKIFGARVSRADDGSFLVGDDTKRATPTTSVDGIVAAIADAIAELGPTPDLVGIGTPGVIAPDDGVVEYAPNLAGFDEPVPLASLVADAVGAPVVIGNDVNMAALGEVRAGTAVGSDDVLAVWMGTGLGAGLVLDGSLRVGPNGLAGELGHSTVVPDGRPCPCGGRGHVEAYIGRRALEARARELHAEGRATRLVELAGTKRMKSKVFSTAYEEGDAVAVELIDEGLEMLTLAIANVLVIVDVTTVVIGGGLGERLGDLAVERIGDGLASLHYAGALPTIVEASLGDHAGALGAAFHAFESLGARP
ncbi:ROK family protein [Actinospongicola halichondriae]|uniref:ROK family protein n=1 Tax=Actinospongicola halichondriae TaxID=3236844 RepID=UPI003D394A5E